MLSTELEKTLHRSLSYANERRHEYATLEHLLLALAEDKDAVAVFRACNVDIERLRREVLSYVDNDLANLVGEQKDDAKPTASFQRVLQRAAIHVQSSGGEEVTGANVLVAMFAERESHAVFFLQEHDMTRFDAVNVVSGLVLKPPEGSVSSVFAAEGKLTADATVLSPDRGIRKIFVSYSHKDQRWVTRLDVHLRPMVNEGLISYWDDRKIKPGSKWRDEIRAALDTASIAILMISADFLASEYITKNEIPPLLRAAEERGCQILPIIISPCRFLRTSSLAEFQAINSDLRPLSGMNAHHREALFTRVAEVIEDLLRPN
jgi:TIR domain/Clp amino terminal domain, pathogenicity island component